MAPARIKKGFTLIEIIIVVSIMVIVALISREFYGSFAMESSVENSAGTIVFDLRNARDKAMTGQGGNNWGIHFINSTNDYYQVFSSPTDYSHASKTIETTTYLSGNIKFSTPAESATADIIFTKLSGNATDTSITIFSGQKQKTISVKTQGLIDY